MVNSGQKGSQLSADSLNGNTLAQKKRGASETVVSTLCTQLQQSLPPEVYKCCAVIDKSVNRIVGVFEAYICCCFNSGNVYSCGKSSTPSHRIERTSEYPI